MGYSEQLKSEREKRGLSLERMAELLCTNPKSVGQWERGQAYPGEVSRWLIEDKLGIRLQERGKA